MSQDAASFYQVLQLAQESATVLEQAITCKRRAGYLHNIFAELVKFLKPMRNADINFIEVEATLHEILSLLRDHFGETKNDASIILQLMDTKRTTQALSEVEDRLETLIKICRFRFEFPSPPATEREMDTDDAEEDWQKLIDMIKSYQGHGHDLIETILALLVEQDNALDFSEIARGHIGTHTQYQAVQQFTLELQEAQESEMATLEEQDITLDTPENILGEGSFNQVLAGMLSDATNGDEVSVAIKRVRPVRGKLQFAEQKALIAQAQCWQGLQHKNIVCLLGTCIIQNRFHLVLERCDFSLHELLFEEIPENTLPRFTSSDKETIVRGISRGLAYLHSKSVIHGDLQPANVLLNQDLGRIKIANFGLATQVRPTWTLVTRKFSVFQAPEVAEEPARWTTKVDIYSLGLVTWALYYEELPYSNFIDQPEEMVTRIVAGQRPQSNSGSQFLVEPWLVRMMGECWHHDPKARPSASDILARFESRTVVRRSTRIIRELATAFLWRNRRGMNLEMVISLVQRLAEPVPRDKLLQTLQNLNKILRCELENPENDDRLRSEVRSRGILKKLKRILELKRDDTEVICESLWLLKYSLSGAAASPFIRAAIQTHGLGKPIVAIMYEHANSTKVQAIACINISDLTKRNKKNCRIFVQELGIGPAIMNALRAQRSSVDVQIQACEALSNLSLNSKNQRILGQELHGCEEVLASMQEHGTSESFQTIACRALEMLALDEQNRILLVQNLNGCEILLSAMKLHQGSARLQSSAYGALWNMSHDSRNREIIGQDLDIINEVVIGMRTHRDNANVQKNGCGLFWSLSEDDNNCVLLGQDIKIGKEVVAAMRVHQMNADVQNAACGLLQKFAKSDKGRDIVLQDGALERVLQACENFPTLVMCTAALETLE